jgi:UDP-N-acetylmuramoyl-L-alanyl-D-glutamate--2,6-diaminopimelate ligase
MGTINYRFKSKVIIAKNTTPGAVELQSLLAKMHVKKVKYCALEVSSHALDQNRVAGVNFKTAIFTNLTQDHLDYHKSLEKYFLAKLKLFKSLSAKSVAIINNDDKYSGRIKEKTSAKIITYGIKKPATVMAKDINFGINFSEFTLVGPKIKIRIRTTLVGLHNIYNILAAIAWGISEKISLKDINSAIEKFKNVSGRLERINCRNGFNIFVDYAHTPDALFNVICALRPLVKGRIIVVFGCGGQRDKLKRPKMGKVVTELADYAIITSDNPRSENPKKIIKDICAGIKKSNYCLKPDRLEAIRAGLSMAIKDDCLLIAGKGHENYQILKNKVLCFSDQEVIKKCLKLMK